MKTTVLFFSVLTVAAGCDSGGLNPAYYGSVVVPRAPDGSAGNEAPEGPDASPPSDVGAPAVDPGADAGPALVLRSLKLFNCTADPVAGLQVSTGGRYLTPVDTVPPWSCTTTCTVIGTQRPGDSSVCDDYGHSFSGTNCGFGPLPAVPPQCSCTNVVTPGYGSVTVSCVADSTITVEFPDGTSLATTCSEATVIVAGAGVGTCT